MFEKQILDYWVDLITPKREITSTLNVNAWIVDTLKITPENREIVIPQKLKDFRKKWEQRINLPDDTKKKIIDTVNKIQKWAKEESDWSMLVEFELWWKRYKALDVNLTNHSDEEYLTSFNYDWQLKNEVMLWWMWWDDTIKRKNRELAEYVDKEKNNRGMEIRTVEFQKNLINNLWDIAGLRNESDKIAMWMYLTWNYGYYWLTMRWKYRSLGRYYPSSHGHNANDDGSFSASLCLIACE